MVEEKPQQDVTNTAQDNVTSAPVPVTFMQPSFTGFCSRIGYRMAGRLLMEFSFEAAGPSRFR